MSKETNSQKSVGARANEEESTKKLKSALGLTNQALQDIDVDDPRHSPAVEALQLLEVAVESDPDAEEVQ